MYFLADNFTAKSSLRDFDLSRNKSLRTLETTAQSIDGALRDGSLHTASSLFTHALSTITSPVFSEVTTFYRDYNFPGAPCRIIASWLPKSDYLPLSRPQAQKAKEASQHRERFDVFYRMHELRDFQLALCADVWDRAEEYSVQTSKLVVAGEKARRGFSNSFPEPLVIYHPRGSNHDHSEGTYGVGTSHKPTAWTPL